eukprot:6212753-Pleurochrysis_carterae.AAC.3
MEAEPSARLWERQRVPLLLGQSACAPAAALAPSWQVLRPRGRVFLHLQEEHQARVGGSDERKGRRARLPQGLPAAAVGARLSPLGA